MTAEPFTILNRKGEGVTVHGERVGDFGCHRAGGDLLFPVWGFTHLPTGMAIARGFRTMADAVDAARAVMLIRNDWSVVTAADVTAELRMKVEAAIAPFAGGSVGRGRTIGDEMVRPHLNGYRPDDPP